MDGLALLCNLFADGPVTLKRLRAAKLSSLRELERAQPAFLAECLHASVPQALAFVEEARKLGRRLAEGAARPVASPPARVGPAVDRPGTSALHPALVPGLDEALVARLREHGVHTVQALVEFAGLALARRTGIPYGTLLELARRARRLAVAPAHAGGVERLPERELVPHRPLRPLPARADKSTLPPLEPESAGPFG